MGLGEIRLGEMGLGEMGLGEMGQNHNNIYVYVAVSICRRFGFLIVFLTAFSCRRRIPTTVRKVRGYGTKSPWYERYERSKDGTKSSCMYESSMVRKVHKWYETSMARKVYGTN